MKKKATAKAIRKKHWDGRKMSQKEKDDYNFNSGRKHADIKWIDAIDERIKELEELVGIPELRRLRKKVRYTWQP